MRQVDARRLSDEPVGLRGVPLWPSLPPFARRRSGARQVVGIVPRVHSGSWRTVKSKTKDEIPVY